MYLSETAGVVFSPPPPPECRQICGRRNNFFWEQANEETKKKRTAELRRLLYVGMTRAENELYITGSLEIKDSLSGSPQDTNTSDDFSLLIKKYIENKCEKNENDIKGDAVLNNDTLFGLLLPAIVCHIPENGLKKESSFFNLEEIKRLDADIIKTDEAKTKRPNNKKGLKKYIQDVNHFYENAEIIKTPVLYNNHITPAALRKTEDGKPDDITGKRIINKEFSGEACEDIFSSVDSILLRFSQNDDGKFNSGSFGTIAHICVEACLNEEEPIIPSNISSLLLPAELSILINAGKEIAARFVLSPLGKIAENASMRENEFSFRSLIKNKKGNEVFINGTVDLFFEDIDSIHIVDFKTDSSEKPWEHTAQMSCYYLAISTLFAEPLKKQCRIWLYYLRTGHALEMTEKVKQFNLEQRALDML